MTLASGTVLTGIGVGLNSAVGRVLRVASHDSLPAWNKTNNDASAEAATLREAIAAVAADLDSLGAKAGGTSTEIFDAMKALLQDDELFEVASENLDAGWSAAASFGMAVNTFAELLVGDAALEERAADLQDLSRRVQANIAGVSMDLELPDTGNIILVGEDFSPADTAQFTPAVVGVVTIKGGPTSHTSIICRSRGIAAVVAVIDASGLATGDEVLVDPVADRIVVGGDQSLATEAIKFVAVSHEPIIAVRSNIGTLSDATAAAKTGAHGVGLFRTEFLYLNHNVQPSIEQQTNSYAEIFAASPTGPIVVRTLDVGGDKAVPFLNLQPSDGAALEALGYRVLSQNRSFVEDQLAAIEAARVQTGREVWVMAPMICEVEQAREFCELGRSIGGFKVGIMVETPAIAAQVDSLGQIVDFVSIGTNDLAQYLFATDRVNPTTGNLLNHWQPELIRTLASVSAAAAAAGIPVAVCGESASDPVFAVVLAGLAITSVSASPSQVDAVRAALSSVDAGQAAAVAARVLEAASPEEAKAAALSALAE